jgi:hypothetical protein
MKWLFRWLFRRELAEVTAITKAAKEYFNVQYVKYETFSMDSEAFLFPIQSICKSAALLFWVLERKRQYEDLIKYGTPANRENNLGRAMAMDEMLKDMRTFETKYLEILAEKARPKSEE